MLRSLKCFMVAKKVTKAESTLRTNEVYSYLTSGHSRAQIIQNCSDWGLSERQVDTYIAKARVLIEKDCDLSRPAFLAECLQRLKRYEQAAAKRGQLGVAVQSVQLQMKATGLES